MYKIKHFTEKNIETIIAFIKAHPFALLAGADVKAMPVATQVPLLIKTMDDKIVLYGHVMKSTDHEKAFRQNNQVLAIFTGANSYVSASWYTNPQQASTWNYMSVYARGCIEFLDEKALKEILQETTDYFEQNTNSPAAYKHLPDEYIHKHIKAIAAFKIEVQNVDAVFKLSQNKDKESYRNITEHLQSKDASGAILSEEMNKRSDNLFKP